MFQKQINRAISCRQGSKQNEPARAMVRGTQYPLFCKAKSKMSKAVNAGRSKPKLLYKHNEEGKSIDSHFLSLVMVNTYLPINSHNWLANRMQLLQLQGTGSSPLLKKNCLEEERGIGKEKGTWGHPSMERVIRMINTSHPFCCRNPFLDCHECRTFSCNCVNIFKKMQKLFCLSLFR